MPITDWQFWVVTMVAIVSVFFFVRALGVLPKNKSKNKKGTRTRTGLTIEGKKQRR